jgi:polar amino acid transport system permease protein
MVKTDNEGPRKPEATAWRNPLSRIRPSQLILLSTLPFIIYLFVSSIGYQSALRFILPGIGTTILVAILAYLSASILGITLAGLLILKIGEKTLLRFLIAGLALALASIFFFTRPMQDYTLVGSIEGRVAIVKGTPDRIADQIKARAFLDPQPVVVEGEKVKAIQVRGVDNAELALTRLQEGVVTGAFIPTEQAPADLPKLWQTTFLPDSARNPGVILLTFGIFLLLLTFGGWSSGHHPLAVFAELYVDLMRGIPMLVIILYVGFPIIGAIRDATGGAIDIPLLVRGVVGISLGYAAYMAEIFRAGIQAIPKGQYEASRSLGLTGWQSARFIILPQALRIVIPPLGNEFIAMVKDTSLLSVLSVRDITQRAREFSSATFQTFPPFNTVAVLYIVLTLAASSLVKYVERRTEAGKR